MHRPDAPREDHGPESNHCGNYADLSAHLDEFIQIADTYDIPAIKAKLKQIVPEYTPQ